MMLAHVDAAPYRAAILEALSREQDRDWDDQQICEFARLFAEAGDLEFRDALYDFFSRREDPEDWIGMQDIIRVDGLPGLRFIVERIGHALLNQTCEGADDDPIRLAARHFEKQVVIDFLQAEAQTSPAIRAYLDGLEEEEGDSQVLTTSTTKAALFLSQPEQQAFRRPPVPTLEELVASVEDDENSWHLFRRFGKHASPR